MNQFEAYEVAQSFFNLRDRRYFLPLVTGSDEEYDDEELFYLKPEAHVRIGPTAVEDVESSYFIVNVPIAQHTSSLQSLFPVENRNSPQNLQYLASILTDQGSFESKMADFHLLLYLSKEVDLDVRLEATLDAPTLMNHLTTSHRSYWVLHRPSAIVVRFPKATRSSSSLSRAKCNDRTITRTITHENTPAP